MGVGGVGREGWTQGDAAEWRGMGIVEWSRTDIVGRIGMERDGHSGMDAAEWKGMDTEGRTGIQQNG